MKKIISLFIALSLILCCSVNYVYAASDDNGSQNYIFRLEYILEDSNDFDDYAIENALFVLTPSATEALWDSLTVDYFERFGAIELKRHKKLKGKWGEFELALDKHDQQNVLDVVEELNKLSIIELAVPAWRVFPTVCSLWPYYRQLAIKSSETAKNLAELSDLVLGQYPEYIKNLDDETIRSLSDLLRHLLGVVANPFSTEQDYQDAYDELLKLYNEMVSKNSAVISVELAQKLEEMSDSDKTNVVITINNFSTQAKYEEAEQLGGEFLERYYQYSDCAGLYVIDELALTEESIVSLGRFKLNAFLNKSQIEQAAALEMVAEIDFDSENEGTKYCGVDMLEKIMDKIPDSVNLTYYAIVDNHYSDSGEFEWSLISTATNAVSPMFLYGILGDRVIIQSDYGTPFDSNYGVYDAKSDTFKDLFKAYNDKRYEGLKESVDSLKLGKLIGDLNGDDQITIADATLFQQNLADIYEFAGNDVLKEVYNITSEKLAYMSDFNRDGERDVNDVTAIQYKLADIKPD